MKISDLTPADVGKWVYYIPTCGRPEVGKIKSWNDTFIFVVYKCDDNWDRYQDYTGCATNPGDLVYG
jgi:hypothetical protein